MCPGKAKTDNLKTGFSTGACATACAKAAFILLQHAPLPDSLSVTFPDGTSHSFYLNSIGQENDVARASVIKNAGDDPDITHNAEITCTLQETHEEASSKDYLLKVQQSQLIIRGGTGVGFVTRKGLDVPKGKWAINPVPREMILTNLKEVGFGNENKRYLLEISVNNGKKLAEKTLNPLLGIIGGISILGTTGYVVPHSNAAYIDTIKILIRNAAQEKLDTIVFCTGSRTHRAVSSDYQDLPEEAFIRIADFISDSLSEAGSYHFNKIIIACMPGKLFKYAQGFQYTHAHHNKLETNKMRDILEHAGVAAEAIESLLAAPTVREILENISDTERANVLNHLGKKALKNIKKWSGYNNCEIRCYNYNNKQPEKWI